MPWEPSVNLLPPIVQLKKIRIGICLLLLPGAFLPSFSQTVSYYDLEDADPRHQSDPYFDLTHPITQETYKYLEGELFTGRVRDHWGNGTFMWEYRYQRGLIHGKFRQSTYTDSKARRKGKAFEGKLHGTVIQWDENNNKRKKQKYHHGMLDGWSKKWHEGGGVLAEKTKYKDDQYWGKHVTFNTQGEMLTFHKVYGDSIHKYRRPGRKKRGNPVGTYHLQLTAEVWGNPTLIIRKDGTYSFSIPERYEGKFSEGTWVQEGGILFLTSNPREKHSAITVIESQRPDSNITVMVKERSSGEPAAFAAILLKKKGEMVNGAQTMEDGKARFTGILPGTFDELEIKWYGRSDLIYKIRNPQTNHFDITIKSAGEPIFVEMIGDVWHLEKHGIFGPETGYLPLESRQTR